MIRRAQLCIDAGGNHFQHILRWYILSAVGYCINFCIYATLRTWATFLWPILYHYWHFILFCEELSIYIHNLKVSHYLHICNCDKQYLLHNVYTYRNADKSLARPGRKQATSMSKSSWTMDPTRSREMPSCSATDLAKIRRSSKISSWILSIISGVVGLRTYQHPGVCVCVTQQITHFLKPKFNHISTSNA
jgi:hypothetical protein